MIEGINSSLANSQASKAISDVVSTANSFASNPERIQQAPIADPYTSSTIRLDSSSAVKAVLLLRETSSGEIVRQYPTESQIKAYSRTQEVLEAVRSNQPSVQEVVRESSSPAPEVESSRPAEVVTEVSSAPAPAPEVSRPAPQADVVQAQQASSTPTTTVSNPASVAQES